MTFNREIDVCGLKCPLPILRTKKTLAEMNTGEILHVLATDPNAAKDFAAFAQQTGNTLLSSQSSSQLNGAVFEFYFQRK